MSIPVASYGCYRQRYHPIVAVSLADLIAPDAFDITDSPSERYNDLLHTYLYTGGMPEAVQTLVDSGLLSGARAVQTRLLRR